MNKIEILHQDTSVVVVNKPPGLNVHSAPGPGSSVVRELAEQGFPELHPVHRLDRDASGVLVFAKSAHVKELTQRWPEVQKTYNALCEGAPGSDCGVIDAPILENQTGKPDRLRNALNYYRKSNPGLELPPLPLPKTSGVHPAGRTSQTSYRVLERFTINGKLWTWLEICPKQGRMHQIRVHLAHARHPLAVDSLYGQRKILTVADISGASDNNAQILLTRMPLHAKSLTFPDLCHPGKELSINAPLPEDLSGTLERLRILSHG